MKKKVKKNWMNTIKLLVVDDFLENRFEWIIIDLSEWII